MIRFRMAKINVDQFAILTEKAPEDRVSYTVNFGFSGALNASRVACSFAVEFMHDDKPILKLGINCEFDLHRDDWDQLVKDNILHISKENLGFFANQTVGVARGIMFCKTESTDFRSFILPPIDLTKILEDDLVIDLKKG